MSEPDSLIWAAPAKLNLYLHVTGKRDDGYHLLDSLVTFATVCDVVRIERASALSLTIDGPFGEGLPLTSDNLVLRAAEKLRQLTGVSEGAHITLTKNLPLSSGIGGGSSDAAATLRGLVRLWGIHPGHHDLSGLALSLGADVPVCLFGRSAFMSGIGERIEPVDDLPEVPMVLVNPGIGVSTPEIFKARTGTYSPSGKFEQTPETLDEFVTLLQETRHNDLAAPAISKQPVIKEVLDQIVRSDGCRLSRMSGSGATCFGFFNTPSQAEEAAKTLAHAYPQWWVKSGAILNDVRSLSAI